MTETEQKKPKKKKKNKVVKNKIKSVFKTTYQGLDKVEVGATALKDGFWHCSWYASFEIPKEIDATVRPGIEWDKTVQSWCQKQYDEIVQSLRQCYGMVRHSRQETTTQFSHFLTSPILVLSSEDQNPPDLTPINVPGWYNFACSFPPTNLVVPDQYEWVTVSEDTNHDCKEDFCKNGIHQAFVKVKDARMLTDDEIKYWSEQSEYSRDMIEFELKHSLPHWTFVGGSPFTDECFELKSYSGINMRGDFTFPAIGDYTPID